MWCHLCVKDYPDFEDFRIHIMQIHRNASEFCKESSESEESEQENFDASEVDNEDDKTDDGTADIITSQEISILNTSSRRKIHNEIENQAYFNASNIDKKSSKKCKKSILKKSVVKRKTKKVVLSKRVLPKRKKSTISFKEDISQHSDSESNEMDHSESSLKTDIKQESVDSQSLSTNNCVISQATSNNSVFLVNPYAGQGTNNYVIGNQAVQPPFYVVNPVITKPTTSKNIKGFDFNSKNILKWLTKLKELCKNIKFPLPPSLYNQVRAVHIAIFDQYYTASISEKTSAVMKVFEELDCMIYKQINSTHSALNVL